MELAEFEKLLEVYFKGETTLSEEQLLREFFTSNEVPGHLEMYRPMFVAFGTAKEETITKEIELPKTKSSNYWKWSIAASFVLLLGIAGFMSSNNGEVYTQEEIEALAAYREVRGTMLLLSENFNEGTDAVLHLDEFNKGVTSLSVIDEFDKSKNLILK